MWQVNEQTHQFKKLVYEQQFFSSFILWKSLVHSGKVTIRRAQKKIYMS